MCSPHISTYLCPHPSQVVERSVLRALGAPSLDFVATAEWRPITFGGVRETPPLPAAALPPTRGPAERVRELALLEAEQARVAEGGVAVDLGYAEGQWGFSRAEVHALRPRQARL